MMRCGEPRSHTWEGEPLEMAEKKRQPKRAKKGEPAERGGKISLYGLSVEDALRAAAKTGRPQPLQSEKPKRQRKKRTKPD
jgi:hypothetical protein